VQAVVAQEEQATNIRDSMKASSNAMAAQIKVKLDQIAQLTKTMANKVNPRNGRGSGGLHERGQAQRDVVQYTKPRSIGCYCSLHGFHLASENHTSATCLWKQPNHDFTSTRNDRKGGSVHWPPPICISIEQQSHATYAGKSAPTN
jgi:hypothetical protein